MRKTVTFILILAVAVTLFLIIYGQAFSSEIDNKISNTLEYQLKESTHQSKAILNNNVKEHFSTLRAAAEYIATFSDIDQPSITKYIGILARQKHYLRIALVSPNGTYKTSDGVNRNKSMLEYDHFLNVLKGNEVVVGPTSAIAEPQKAVVMLAVPIIKDNNVVGGLYGTVEVGKINELFNIAFAGDTGITILIDSRNTIITTPLNSKIIKTGDNFFNNLVFDFSADTNKALDNEGIFYNEETKEKFYYYIEPTGISDWSIVTMASSSNIYNQVLSIRDLVTLFACILFVSIAIFLTVVIILQNKERKVASTNEYCLKMLSEQSGSVLLEWDFKHNKIRSVCNFEKVYGRKMATINSAKDAIDSGFIHPDDIEVFKNIFDNIKAGTSVAYEKFRIKDATGNYRWCDFSGTVLTNKKGKPYMATGTIIDVDAKEKENENLRKKANYDALTNLFNKKTTEILIKNVLQNSHSQNLHAFIAIDLDNFKVINDTLGHLFGDTVLVDFAKVIKSSFRSTDIIGRFGGDEFICFVRDIPNKEFVIKKVESIIDKLQKSYTQDDIVLSVSVSVGIAFYPKDGEDYLHLFEKSDSALYEAKKCGKNMYYVAD